MKEQQKEAMRVLISALDAATQHGVLDDLAKWVHPDIINLFCDAVGEMETHEIELEQ